MGLQDKKERRLEQEKAFREQYNNKLPDAALENLIIKLCEYRSITEKDTWKVSETDVEKNTCIVREWEIVNIVGQDMPMQFLYGTVVSDYKARVSAGGYVFSSIIKSIDEHQGLIQTENSLYCLSGYGEEVNATLQEAWNMKTLGQSLQTLRGLVAALGPNATINGPYIE